METAQSTHQGGVLSYRNSPVPRQQLIMLSTNQRSYSRLSSSKGATYDDDSLALLSPLPLYPRRRSVTFASQGKTAPPVNQPYSSNESVTVREERPYYTTLTQPAPLSPARDRADSPTPVSILKPHSSYGGVAGEEESNRSSRRGGGAHAEREGAAVSGEGGSAVSHPPAATATQESLHSFRPASPTTSFRARSSSRQRLAARRREAQMHYGFYDDSFVEDFVLSARAQMEQQAQEEEEARRRAEADVEAMRIAAAQEMTAAEEADAAVTAADAACAAATGKPNLAPEKMLMTAADHGWGAIQRVKTALLAAAQRRRSSVTPPPAREEGRRASHPDVQTNGDASLTTALAPERKKSRTITQEEHTHTIEEHSNDDHVDEDEEDEAVLRAALRELLGLPSSSSRTREAGAGDKGRNVSSVSGRSRTRRRCANDAPAAARVETEAHTTSEVAATPPRRRPSEPLVSADADAGETETSRHREGDGLPSSDVSRRAKLQRLVARLLSRRGRHTSRRSVVVIDWSNDDETDDRANEKEGSAPRTGGRRAREVYAEDAQTDEDGRRVGERAEDTHGSNASEESDDRSSTNDNDEDADNEALVRLRRRAAAHTRTNATASMPRSCSRGTCAKRVRLHDDGDDDARGANVPDGEQTTVRHTRASRSRSVRSTSAQAASAMLLMPAASKKPPTREPSAMPELTESILMEEESSGPILLPRRRHRRPEITRSISQLRFARERDDDSDDGGLCPPPRSRRGAGGRGAATTTTRPSGGGEEADDDDVWRRPMRRATNHASTAAAPTSQTSRRAADGGGLSRSHSHRKMVHYSNVSLEEEGEARTASPARGGTTTGASDDEDERHVGAAAVSAWEERNRVGGGGNLFGAVGGSAHAVNTSRRHVASHGGGAHERGRSGGRMFGATGAAPAAAPAAASASTMPRDDPMAVFFQAAFPSPSKFDEILRSAGGMVETSQRGGGRGGRRRMMHQPNLVLPASIVRQR